MLSSCPSSSSGCAGFIRAIRCENLTSRSWSCPTLGMSLSNHNGDLLKKIFVKTLRHAQGERKSFSPVILNAVKDLNAVRFGLRLIITRLDCILLFRTRILSSSSFAARRYCLRGLWHKPIPLPSHSDMRR